MEADVDVAAVMDSTQNYPPDGAAAVMDSTQKYPPDGVAALMDSTQNYPPDGAATVMDFTKKVINVDRGTAPLDSRSTRVTQLVSNTEKDNCMLPASNYPPGGATGILPVSNYSPGGDTGMSSKCNQWGLNLFTKWIVEHNEKAKRIGAKLKFDPDILHMDGATLNTALCMFMKEVKSSQNGTDYSPRSVMAILNAIQHFICAHFKSAFSFLDTTDPTFQELRHVLDEKIKELTKKGLGEKKQSKIITEEEEDEMWARGVLGTHTPQVLLNTVIYTLGTAFSLKAGNVYRRLSAGPASQITVKSNAQGRRYLEYKDDTAMSQPGNRKKRKTQILQKCIQAFDEPSRPDRCIVRIYEKYMSLR